MIAVLLCGGQGSRLRPLTLDRPKAMVSVGGRPIVDRQIDLLTDSGIHETVIVAGHCFEAMGSRGTHMVVNDEYRSTNMVYGLFRAASLLESHESVIVSYGDILYSTTVLQSLLSSDNSYSVVVDHQWYNYFARRSENVLDDAETLRIQGGRIVEIGNKPTSVQEIDGQFIGLMKFDRAALHAMRSTFDRSIAEGSRIGWGRTATTAFMTDLLQEMIVRGAQIHPVAIEGGWLEIDTLSDLLIAEELLPTIET